VYHDKNEEEDHSGGKIEEWNEEEEIGSMGDAINGLR